MSTLESKKVEVCKTEQASESKVEETPRMSTRSTIKVSRIAGRRKNSVEYAASRGGQFSQEEAQLCKSASGLGEPMESVQQINEAKPEGRKRLGV